MEILLIIFSIMIVVSAIGVVLLNLLKKNKSQDFTFYFLCLWSALITFINASSLPSNYLLQRGVSISIFLVTLISLGIKLMKPEKVKLSNIIISLSIIIGIIDLLI